jgi:WD40 repeat protein
VFQEASRAGGLGRLEIREVSAVTGRTLKTLLKVEADFFAHALSDDGRRLAKLSRGEQITVYDVDRGAKLWDRVPKFETIEGSAAQPVVAFSPNGKWLAATWAVGRPVVLNADTGDPLPALEGAELLTTFPRPGVFSWDGRFLAMSGNRYVAQEVAAPPGRPKQTSYSAKGRFLTIWDTETGKVVKTWDRAATVAFSPTRPLLAVFEQNDDQTRLGLWDFSDEPAERK